MPTDPDQHEEHVDVVDQDDAPTGQEYSPPALIALGSFEELTQGPGPSCVMA